MPNLDEVQNSIAEALLDRSVRTPDSIRGAKHRRSDRRFGVYRNNVAVSLALLWQIYSRCCSLQIHFRQYGHRCGGG